MKRSHRCSRALAPLAAAAILAVAMPLHPANAQPLCDGDDLLLLANRPTTEWSSCVVAADQLVLETGYYQNASSVGQSEVAGYPNAQVRAGVSRGVEVILDAPSQIDVSGNHGRGFFSLSGPGIGLKWQVADRSNTAYDLGAEVSPPSTAASLPWQPKFEMNFDSTTIIEKRLQTNVGIGLIDDGRLARYASGTTGLRSSAGLGLLISPASLLSVEVNDQSSVARSIRGQSFGDVAWRQQLSRRVVLDVEGGQTFNTAAHTRPHYVGAGLALDSSS